MDQPTDPLPEALNVERHTASLHQAAQQLAVLAANVARKPSAEALLGLATRVDETITSAHGLIHRLRAVRATANRGYRQQQQQTADV